MGKAKIGKSILAAVAAVLLVLGADFGLSAMQSGRPAFDGMVAVTALFKVGAILLFLFFLVLWVWKFASLMSCPNSAFNGDWDRVIWAAVFILVLPLAPFAFWIWEVQRSRR